MGEVTIAHGVWSGNDRFVDDDRFGSGVRSLMERCEVGNDRLVRRGEEKLQLKL